MQMLHFTTDVAIIICNPWCGFFSNSRKPKIIKIGIFLTGLFARNTYDEVTSPKLWLRYDRHFVGITWHNVWS